MFKYLLIIALLSGAAVTKAQQWQYNVHPAEAGWNMEKLNALRKFVIDSTHITGMMIIYKGKVVFDYGSLEDNSYIASCRKSILAMLFGEHIRSGEINLNSSLKNLKIDDAGGLSAGEKEATVRDIISARSGVYHPASNPGDHLDVAPARNSKKHGNYWLYSNWDFNMAGYIFEKETHRNIYDEVERVLARPLGMQDWNRKLQHREGDTTRSLYTAYHLWFSTRDMARIGQLMLQKGNWMGKQLIDSAWVAEMVKPHTDYKEVRKNIPSFDGTDYNIGYGYMWWLWQNSPDKRFTGAYSAMGAFGQSISVFPAIDAVVVYKTNVIYERETPYLIRFRTLRLAVRALTINDKKH